MSVESVKKFFESLQTDPRAQELLKDCPRPESLDDTVKAYADVAGKMGLALTEDDLRSALEEEMQNQKHSTEAAAEKIRELPDEAMEQVAGGKQHYECHDTYKDHENCWFNDGCDIVFRSYEHYCCHWHDLSPSI